MFAAILWPPYVCWQPCHGLPKLHEWSGTRHRVTSDAGIITLDRLGAIDRPADLAGRPGRPELQVSGITPCRRCNPRCRRCSLGSGRGAVIMRDCGSNPRSTAGRPALHGREPGQVRKEAATAILCKCRGNGSPPRLFARQITLILRCSPALERSRPFECAARSRQLVPRLSAIWRQIDLDSDPATPR